MKYFTRAPFLAAVVITISISSLSLGQAQSRIRGQIDAKVTVPLSGNVHPLAKPQYDKGPAEPSLKLGYITMLLKPTVQQAADLQRLISEQQNKTSPNYHKWFTPEEYADRFGLSGTDMKKITTWLRDQGFVIVDVAGGRNWIAFSGTARQVHNAFHTEIHRYNVKGEMHFANATDPSIPKALAGVVVGFRGLNDFRLRPEMHNPRSRGVRMNPDFGVGGTNFLAPGDLATIYDLSPLYTAGFNGAGQKLVIVGQSDINLADIQAFRSTFNLPKNNPQIVLVGSDPGHTAAEVEADLDIEWSGAIARTANITYVNAKNVLDSAQYAIDHDLAPVISMSFGLCEMLTSGEIAQIEPILQQANTEGITFVASSGDSGAADCDLGSSSTATQGLAVDYPASSPEVTGVGGTEFDEGTGDYWNTINGVNGGSALSYIPEMGWNDSPGTGTSLSTTLSASGGGASSCIATDVNGNCTGGFPKPSWQSGSGVPNDNVRDVPDVSFSASPNHDGYLICGVNGVVASGLCTGSEINVVGGTSVAAPVFAGLIALLNNFLVSEGVQASPGLGNINATLYQLFQSSTDIFHDTVTGNNIVSCQTGTPDCPSTGSFGYAAGPGYDQVTGLGSVDSNNFIIGWIGPNLLTTSTTVTALASQVAVGGILTLTAQVIPTSGSGAPTGNITFATQNGQIATTAIMKGGASTSTSTLPLGDYTVTAAYDGNLAFASSTSSAIPVAVVDFAMQANSTSLSVSPGQKVQTTLTITPEAGFASAVSLSCFGLPAETTCNLSPITVLPNGAPVTTTLTIQTTGPSAKSRLTPFDTREDILYALLIPLAGFLQLKLRRKSRSRGVLMLIGTAMCITALMFSLQACGGGGSSTPPASPSNPGTPAGTSTVKVAGSSIIGTTTLQHQTAITLTVQ